MEKSGNNQPKGAEKAPFYYVIVMYGDVYNIAVELQILGKTGWYGKVCSQAASLDFMIELQDVICHGGVVS